MGTCCIHKIISVLIFMLLSGLLYPNVGSSYFHMLAFNDEIQCIFLILYSL